MQKTEYSNGRASEQSQSCNDARHLSDEAWFELHPDKNLRIREVDPDLDGCSKDSARYLCVGVSRTGGRGYMPIGNLARMRSRS
jgi:hypothetical protein